MRTVIMKKKDSRASVAHAALQGLGTALTPRNYSRPSACCGWGVVFLFLLSTAPVPILSSQQAQGPADGKEAAPAENRIDLKAQEFLDQAVRALGGDAFLSSKNLRTEGRVFAINEESTSGFAKYESTIEYPGKRRFSYGKGTPVTLINDGVRGWQLDRYGLVRQPPEQVRLWNLKSRYGYESLLRTVIREQGLLIQYSGTEFIGPLSTHVISITDSSQAQIRIYLDAKRSLPAQVTYRLLNPKTRDWEEYGEGYADFKVFQGIMTPMQITSFLNGKRSGETFRKSAEYNVEIPANYFTPGG